MFRIKAEARHQAEEIRKKKFLKKTGEMADSGTLSTNLSKPMGIRMSNMENGE